LEGLGSERKGNGRETLSRCHLTVRADGDAEIEGGLVEVETNEGVHPSRGIADQDRKKATGNRDGDSGGGRYAAGGGIDGGTTD
jgi:hypothetical protein